MFMFSNAIGSYIKVRTLYKEELYALEMAFIYTYC